MTMTNAEWCIKNGIQFRKVGRRPCSDPDYESIGYYDTYGNYNECYKGKCLGDLVSESILTWLDMEHIEQILDEAEKRYLAGVIRPFRKTVMYIKKYSGTYSEVNYESIVVCVEGDFARKTPFSFCLPAFKTGTMYKGMEVNRHYTLEELGL